MTQILFPVGRLIGGSVHKLKGKLDKAGQPKLGKDGKQVMAVNFGVAIPKTQARWQDESYMHPTKGLVHWGDEVFNVGKGAAPTMHLDPTFAWKVTDGDSTLPNKKGNKPCDQTGYPGNWVIWFSQGWLPKRVNADGSVELPDGAIVPGFYIQVFGSVAGNKLVPNGTPGVYLNPIAVALVGEGDKITVDVDTTAVGFGGAPLPVGARPVQAAEPAFAGQVTPLGGVGGMPVPHVTQTPVMPPGVVPAPDFLNPPPAGPRMTPAATATREQYHAAGWTDAQLVQHGLMVM